MNSAIFNPQTVAVIGATDRVGSVGRGLILNLKEGDRDLFYVNPGTDKVFEEKTYNNVLEIEKNIDLAIIAIPKTYVSEAVDDCIKKEVGGVIIISAGFAETDQEGAERQKEIADKLKEAEIPLVGPNCLGILRPPVNFNASFAPATPKRGSLALISQSGALIDSIIDGAKDQNYGFSLIISVGNAAGITLSEYIQIVAEDEDTEVICLYIEGLKEGRRFLKVLKEIEKPVVVLKGGATEKAKKAISSHTGSLAGSHRIFSAALRQAGAFQVNSLEELFNVAKALAWQPPCDKSIGVITNGGGAGVLLTDYLYDQNLVLADVKEQTIKGIEEDMHPDFSKGNPLDIVGDALPERYMKATEAFLDDPRVSAVVVIQTLQIMTDPIENAHRLVELKKRYDKPIITVYMGAGEETKKGVRILEENGIPNYSDPIKAAKPLKALNYKFKNLKK